MVAVIADDITGAAEMAGIAHRLGLRVKLTMHPQPSGECDVLVVATDTRSMTEAEGVGETARVTAALSGMEGVDALFRKTDSALRGHVVAELEAMLGASRYGRALYLPANPSKGRIIRDGVYYIGDKPLHETDFSFDPEFPAFSSVLSERFPDGEERGVVCADAVTAADVARVVGRAGEDTLLAGAADLFTAFLLHRFPSADGSVADGLHAPLAADDCLIVCGSTQSKPIGCGVATRYMPTAVYDGVAPVGGWLQELAEEYAATRALIIAVRDRHRTGKEVAVYLRGAMADLVSGLAGIHCPKELVIEGGATAFAILHRLGWEAFTITDEFAPGVIRMMAANGTHVTMKPGSYPWGGLF